MVCLLECVGIQSSVSDIMSNVSLKKSEVYPSGTRALPKGRECMVNATSELVTGAFSTESASGSNLGRDTTSKNWLAF